MPSNFIFEFIIVVCVMRCCSELCWYVISWMFHSSNGPQPDPFGSKIAGRYINPCYVNSFIFSLIIFKISDNDENMGIDFLENDGEVV